MANTVHTSRRTFLSSVPAAIAAGTLGTCGIAPAVADEHPWTQARRLAIELAAVMAAIEDLGDGAHVAIADPDGSYYFTDRAYHHHQQPSSGLTREQTAAIEAWQVSCVDATDAWTARSKFTRNSGACAVADRNAISEGLRQRAAHDVMTRALWPRPS